MYGVKELRASLGTAWSALSGGGPPAGQPETARHHGTAVRTGTWAHVAKRGR